MYVCLSLFSSQEHTHRESISSIRKCIKWEERGNDHSLLVMNCPLRNNVTKKNRWEITHNTNNHHNNLSIHSHPQVLAHSNIHGNSTPVTSVKSPPGYTNPIPNSITFKIHPIPGFEKSNVSYAVITIIIISESAVQGRERVRTLYQSKDPNPTQPTHGRKKKIKK